MEISIKRRFNWTKLKLRSHVHFFIALIFILLSFSPAYAFEPSDITNLELWLKADSLSLNNNDPVSSWSDSSTAGNNFSQTNANDQPAFKTSVSSLNNKPAVHFDGAQFIDSLANFALNDFALFIVYQDDGTTQQNERLLDHDFTNGFYLGRNKNSKNSWGGGVLEANNPFGVFVKLDNDQPHVLYSEREGSVHYIIGDGIEVKDNNVDDFQTNLDIIRLGQRIDTTNPAQFYKGDIAEVILYNRSLTDTERMQVEEYLGDKYNIPMGSVGIKMANPAGELEVNGVFRLTPQTEEPTCSPELEGGLYYGATTKDLFLCNGTDWGTVQVNYPTPPTPHDGTNWEQITTGTPMWGDRNQFESVVFDSKMWILQGQVGSATSSSYSDEIWYTSDGANWTEVTGTGTKPTERESHGAVVYNGKIYVMGGRNTGGNLNDVWRSDDGINWTQIQTGAAWPARAHFDVVVYDNKMWILGGYGSSGGLNDVWHSTDGITWTPTTNAPWSARYGHSAMKQTESSLF